MRFYITWLNHLMKLLVDILIVLGLVQAHGERHELFLLLEIKLILVLDECIFEVCLLQFFLLLVQICFEPVREVAFAVLARR